MSNSPAPLAGRAAGPRPGRWWILLVVVASLLLVALLLSFLFQGQEPIYEGLKISRFIELRGHDATAKAAIELGPDQVVPHLIEALLAEDSSLKRGKMALWKRLPGWYVKKHRGQTPMPAESTRERALWALRLIGPEASAAVPEVARLALHAPNRNVEQEALAALGQIGVGSTQALAVLLHFLDGTNAAARWDASLALAWFGTQAKTALPKLLREFEPNGPRKPFASVVALHALGPEAAPAVPLLAAVLDDNTLDPYAVEALKNIGPAAAPAVPGLCRYIEAHRPGYPLAVEALLNIGPPARSALPLLKSLRDEGNAVVRVLAAVAESRIENNPAAAIPVLRREIEGNDLGHPAVRDIWVPTFASFSHISMEFDSTGTAIWFLGECGPVAKEAVPALTAQLTNRIDWRRSLAAQAIWKITQETNLALPAMIESLQKTNLGDLDFVRAATLLGQLGPSAHAAVPHLLEHRKRNWNTWRVGNAALKRIQSPEVAHGVPASP